jgi:hypothetical protein
VIHGDIHVSLFSSELTVGFIGESGAHSFLEQIRQIFRKNSGESPFTLDVQRFNMVDGPSHSANPRAVQLPSPAKRDELINLFEINVQPFAYVFHMDDFRQMIQETYENPFETPRYRLCLIHLSFALASGYVNEDDSVRFFESGMGLMEDPIEDGDLWIVQALLLVALYYQLVCKRNAFWIALGTSHRVMANEVWQLGLRRHLVCTDRVSIAHYHQRRDYCVNAFGGQSTSTNASTLPLWGAPVQSKTGTGTTTRIQKGLIGSTSNLLIFPRSLATSFDKSIALEISQVKLLQLWPVVCINGVIVYLRI